MARKKTLQNTYMERSRVRKGPKLKDSVSNLPTFEKSDAKNRHINQTQFL